MSETRYDYIVAAPAPLGCLLANRLSADKRKRVLLVEAGGNDDYLWVHVPVGYLYCIGNPRTDWLYATDPDPGLNGRSPALPARQGAGRLLEHQRHDLHARPGARLRPLGRAHRQPTLDAGTECLPHCLKARDFHRVPTRFTPRPASMRAAGARRRSGAWRSSACAGRSSTPSRRRRSRAGIPATDDFNRGDNEGVGYFEVNQRAGVRWNATKAFLRPVQQRDNLQVWTGAQSAACCWRIATTGLVGRLARTVGIEVLPQGGGAAIEARLADGGEVILAAGAIGTPQILQLSGIGPGGAAARARHRGRARAARRRREPAGPSCRSARCSRSRA